MDKSFDLGDRRILITGAASGMGRAFAQLAAADGAHVGLLDIDGKGLDETMGMLEGDGRRTAVAVDLAEWGETEAAIGECRDVLGGFDAVCNVAGWDAPGRFWEQPLEQWEKLIAVNLWSALHVCRATVPDLIEQKSGTIVNVSSDAGRVGSKGETVYAAAKGGVMALTKSLARELAPYNVTINCICPGPTMTPLLEQEMRDNPKLIEKLIRAVPMGRAGEVEDMARSIAFFASPASSYITAQILSVSGGLTMVG
jgi:2-hydroxycyclohexanecarboxyl-CoA dehydrogenase